MELSLQPLKDVFSFNLPFNRIFACSYEQQPFTF